MLTWFEAGMPLTTEEVGVAERRLGVKFPPAYAQTIALHSGASNPDECEFEYLDRGRKRVGNFGTLLSLRDDQLNNLFETIDNLGDQLPKGIVPVIDTGSGDCVCLDYRTSLVPPVVYFAHERIGEDAIVPLEDSFADFLNVLRKPDEE